MADDPCTKHPVGLLLSVAERLHAHLDSTARSVGVTHAQVKLLVQLDQPRRLSDLASIKACDPSSITSLVQRLERDGLVQREIDPDDARARRIRITAKGKRLRQKFLDGVGDGSTAMHDLTSDERAALAAFIAAG